MTNNLIQKFIPLTGGIMTNSGAYFDYNHPEEWDGPIEDIAHALSNICRFAGHTDRFYSVAQHCVNASYIVPQEYAFTALCHDMAEAFTNDITTPLKTALPIFKELEQRIESTMANRFAFDYPYPDEVHLADKKMLKIERERLFKKANKLEEWEMLRGIEIDDVEALEAVGLVRMGLMTPTAACQLFLLRFRELTR